VITIYISVVFGPDSVALNLARLGALMQSAPLAPISLFQRNDESLKVLRGFVVKANKSFTVYSMVVNIKLLTNVFMVYIANI